ncbi:hypothetical protein [Qaidamihabitans albus]|uniref:hypothetical protein n=1 Tax=Qaidamihabitans albus TaxID=2795733 RepID=UPI0018F134A8|nr:hypothetical protein [Qaidamihabitans albus]
MITLAFLGRWLKLAALTALALVIEYGVTTTAGWFALTAGLTLAVFGLLTAALFTEWRHQHRGGGAYHYQIIRHTDHE